MGGRGGQRRGQEAAVGGEDPREGSEEHVTRHTSHVTCFMLVRRGDFIATVAELSFWELMLQGFEVQNKQGSSVQ